MALISVTISGNASPLKKSIDEAEGVLGKFGGSIKKFGVLAAAGMGAVATGIGIAAKAAADDQKSFEQLSVTLRNLTGASEEMVKAVDDQIGAMSLATGIADDKLRPAFEALVRGTKDTETAMRDMSLVLDISTALQMDQTAVADALAKAYEGNYKALRTLSPEMASMIAEGASLDEVMGTLGKTFGGSAAAAADTFSGRMDRLKVFMGELVEQIGYYVLPMLSNIAQFILEQVIPAVQRFVERYGPAMRDIFETIADFINDKVVPVLRDRLIPFIERVAEFIGTKLVPIIRDVALIVFDKLQKIFGIVSEKIRDNSENIQKIVGFFRALTEFVTQKVAPALVTVLGKAFDIVAAAIGPVIDIVFDLMGAFADLGKFLIKVAGFVVSVFEGMINTVISGINLAIRALNILPGVDIGEIGEVSFAMPSFGNAPTAPTAAGNDYNAGAADLTAGLSGGTISGFSFGTSGGSTSGGSSGGSTGGLTDWGKRMIAGMENPDPNLYDYMNAGTINITVNTVSADAELPNLIVEALQTYNLTSGPIDIAVAA